MLTASLLKVFGFAAVLFASTSAHAAIRRVPAQYPTIQAAIDAASDGDRVRVSAGDYCGAIVTKRVSLEGRGRPRIVGCDTGPTVTAGTRVGFFLPGSRGVNAASGTKITGFTFDGRGVSNANLAPLSFGVFARYASDVRVTRNRFLGTVQAITNTGGDRWVIRRNKITSLTLLDCTLHCTGGDGIVIALGRGALSAPGGDAEALNRPEDNVVSKNSISGTPPDGFALFSMVGVLLLSADHTSVIGNRIRMRDNPAAASIGEGIVVANTCCGLASSFLPGSRNTTLAFNDVRRSEAGIIVDGSGGVNTEGLFLFRNRGQVTIEGALQLARAARSGQGARLAEPTL